MSKTKTPKTRAPRLTQGELIEVSVSRFRPDGLASGEADNGCTTNVYGGVPGDRVSARVTHAGQHMTWARTHEVTAPSPDRVNAPCPVVLRCGGCIWQMVAPSRQQAERHNTLTALLQPVLGADNVTWHAAETSASEGYRTRALMMTRHQSGRLKLGFFEPRTNQLVPRPEGIGCVAHHPRLRRSMAHIEGILDQAQLATWRGQQRPGLRAVSLRLDPQVPSGGILTLVTGLSPGGHISQLETTAKMLMTVDGVCGVHVAMNDTAGGQILSGTLTHLAGARRQELKVGEDTFLVGPTAFLQTNTAVAERLLQIVSKAVPEQMKGLADLYAGVGIFGLSLRKRAERVVLVEQHPAAVSDAHKNINALSAKQAQVIEGDASEAASQALKGCDTVILDPPRSGCRPPVIDAVLTSKATTLVYVSCNPKSLARDLALLVAGGFAASDVWPLEMFPHTPHQEVVVRMTRTATK